MSARKYFDWTEAKKHHFAVVVQKYEGHKKTADSMKIKWEKIHTKLLCESDFAGLSIKQDSLKVQFDRNKTEVLESCGISEEGANLSGLPEEASEYIKLMILLAKEDHDLEHSKKVAKDKKKAVQKALLNHEIANLEEQGPFANNGDQLLPIPTATVVAVVEDSSHHCHCSRTVSKAVCLLLPHRQQRLPLCVEVALS